MTAVSYASQTWLKMGACNSWCRVIISLRSDAMSSSGFVCDIFEFAMSVTVKQSRQCPMQVERGSKCDE